MLDAILYELRTASGPLTLRQLSLKLGVQESALEGMVHFLARKGALTLVEGPGGLRQIQTCDEVGCRLRCPGPGRCSLRRF